MNAFDVPLLVRVALVGAAYVVLLVSAELWYRWKQPPAEWTRKYVHVSGGVVALAFPWLFETILPVVVLGAAFALLLWGSKRVGMLPSIHAVERRSEGGAYYPVAILVLFALAHDTPVLYLVPLGALVVSDAVAALVGTTYGRHVFAVEDGRRSVEGSVTFFLATFLIVHLPLLLLTDLTRPACVLIATQVALLVTLFEAISVGGGDNLVVPAITYFLLVKMMPKTAAFIGVQLLCQVALLGLLLVVGRQFRLLTTSGILAASLVFYTAFSLGEPRATVTPALGLAAFLYARHRLRGRLGGTSPRYQVRAVFYTSIVPLAVVIVDNWYRVVLASPAAWVVERRLYAPYVGAFTAHLALLLFVWLSTFDRKRHSAFGHAAAALGIAGGVVVPLSLAVGPVPVDAGAVVLATTVPLLALALYLVVRMRWGEPASSVVELRRQAGAVLAAVLLLVWAVFVP